MVHIWIIVTNQITNTRYSFNVKAYLFSFTSQVGYFVLLILYVHVLHTVLQPKHLLLCHCIVIHPFFLERSFEMQMVTRSGGWIFVNQSLRKTQGTFLKPL